MISIDVKEDFNKQKLYENNMKYMLNRLQSMFKYENLPDTIPENELEAILIKYGSAFVTEIDGKLYAFNYSPVNELDVYGNFTKVNVTNVALNLGKVFPVESGVVCDNDYMRMGLFPLMSQYSMMMAENTITMKNVNIMLRMTNLISAPDNQTKASAEMYIEKLEKGEFAIVTSNPFFEGVKVQNSTGVNSNYLHQFIEYHQYLKGSFFNELGLNANFNMKASTIGSNESALNRDFLHPLIDCMKECRDIFVNALNEKYGLNVTVDYNSSWKLEQEEKTKEEYTVLNNETIRQGIKAGENEPSPPPQEDEPSPPSQEDEPEENEPSPLPHEDEPMEQEEVTEEQEESTEEQEESTEDKEDKKEDEEDK